MSVLRLPFLCADYDMNFSSQFERHAFSMGPFQQRLLVVVCSGFYKAETLSHRSSIPFPIEIDGCYLGGIFRKGNEVFTD